MRSCSLSIFAGLLAKGKLQDPTSVRKGMGPTKADAGDTSGAKSNMCTALAHATMTVDCSSCVWSAGILPFAVSCCVRLAINIA